MIIVRTIVALLRDFLRYWVWERIMDRFDDGLKFGGAVVLFAVGMLLAILIAGAVILKY